MAQGSGRNAFRLISGSFAAQTLGEAASRNRQDSVTASPKTPENPCLREEGARASCGKRQQHGFAPALHVST